MKHNILLGEVAPREIAEGSKIHVASLLDIAGTKAAVVQQRAQARDYLDIDALIRHGIDLPARLPVLTPHLRRTSEHRRTP